MINLLIEDLWNILLQYGLLYVKIPSLICLVFNLSEQVHPVSIVQLLDHQSPEPASSLNRLAQLQKNPELVTKLRRIKPDPFRTWTVPFGSDSDRFTGIVTESLTGEKEGEQ